MPLGEVEALAVERVKTGSGELDRVLGGGIVPGSIVLMGGSPGIGKSTLMSAALGRVQDSGRRSLYVSGEESAAQVRLRAERLGAGALAVPVIAETSLETVIATIEAERPDVCVVDSVQTLHSEVLTGAAGSVGQVREVAARLERLARELGTAVILVGHVTKDGTLAGPRVLEHAVDCVLQFEGEPQRTYRTLRALKNRFGSTNEIGVFEMRSGGLTEVADPSERFVREAEPVAGSCLLCAMEGSRPLLVEVQALVAPSDVVPPRRVANGVDRNRLSLVLAVLARNGGPSLGSADVFVSVAGGVRIEEPGADLAIALAIASAATGARSRRGHVPTGCFGEVGLTGRAALRRPSRAPPRGGGQVRARAGARAAARHFRGRSDVPGAARGLDGPRGARGRGRGTAARQARRLAAIAGLRAASPHRHAPSSVISAFRLINAFSAFLPSSWACRV